MTRRTRQLLATPALIAVVIAEILRDYYRPH